ncbi:MAG: GAF domain-containing protein [Paludibacteraceae bacterium]|nr:GAF domain-containing protein [Paludibacteraceae bacterium]
MPSKIELYEQVLEQIRSVVVDETDMIANMANTVAILQSTFGFWWTGFYRVQGEQLVLGPFQGPVACTRIRKGKGVCGTAWEKKETLIVSDVHKFKGHIACSSESNSEIVVPMIRNAEVEAVLDIDSREFGCFDTTDKLYLEKVVDIIANNTK